MSPRTPLLAAAALSLVAGVSVGAAAPTHAASGSSVPSIQVTGPCIGGAGVISARSYRTADGGVAAQTRITGVAPGTRWQGETIIGQAALSTLATPDSDPSTADAPQTLTASSDGVVTDSARSEKSWPRFYGAVYMRSNYGAVCVGMAQLHKGAFAALASSTAVLVRPGMRAVRVFDEGVKKDNRWRVAVALTGPAGTTRLTQFATADEGGLDLRFGNVAHLRGVTRVVVRAVNLANGKVHWLRVTRTS